MDFMPIFWQDYVGDRGWCMRSPHKGLFLCEAPMVGENFVHCVACLFLVHLHDQHTEIFDRCMEAHFFKKLIFFVQKLTFWCFPWWHNVVVRAGLA